MDFSSIWTTSGRPRGSPGRVHQPIFGGIFGPCSQHGVQTLPRRPQDPILDDFYRFFNDFLLNFYWFLLDFLSNFECKLNDNVNKFRFHSAWQCKQISFAFCMHLCFWCLLQHKILWSSGKQIPKKWGAAVTRRRRLQ